MGKIITAACLVLALAGAVHAETRQEISVTVASARIDKDVAGELALFIQVDGADREMLARFTEQHVGAQLSLSVNGKEISRPTLVEPIKAGSTVLTCRDQCSEIEAALLDGKSKLMVKLVQ